MALTPKGFQGTVTESDIAKSAPHFGPPKVEGAGDFKVTAVSGLDRTVAIAAGFADACFVRVENTAPANRQSATLSSGTRWDTVVLRRDWVADTVTLVIVTGTSAKAVAADVENDPGNVHDQVLALVQITSGVQAPTAVEDMRVWHSPVLTANSLLALADAPLGTEAVIAGARHRRNIVGGSVETVAVDPQIASGLHAASMPGGSVTSRTYTVPLPAGKFRSAPQVMVELATSSGNSNVMRVRFIQATTSAFQYVIYRPEGGAAPEDDYPVAWLAIAN